MKVFICWSDEPSKSLARCLREWIELALHPLRAFVSSHDIESGERWQARLDMELASTDFGILCLTPGNTAAPWILYEAGALGKAVEESRVCPLLFEGVPWTALPEPIKRFQGVQFSEDGMSQLSRDLNRHLGEDTARSDSTLAKTFETYWPELRDGVECVLKKHADAPPVAEPKVEEMFAEILTVMHDIRRARRDPRAHRQREMMRLWEELGLGNEAPPQDYTSTDAMAKMLDAFAEKLELQGIHVAATEPSTTTPPPEEPEEEV